MKYQQKGIIKARQRNRAVENRGITYKTALMFPSEKCEDVLQGFNETCIFNRDTFMLAIEKDRSYVPKIKRTIHKLFDNAEIFNTEASNVDLREILGQRKIDYCFYDICGGWKPDIANWFYHNNDLFAQGARLAITICVNQRQADFLKAAKSVCCIRQGKSSKEARNISRMLLPALAEQFPDIENVGFAEAPEQTKENFCTQLNAISFSMPDREIVLNKVVLYRNHDVEKDNEIASYMAYIDMEIYNTKMNIKEEKRLLRWFNKYNSLVGVQSQVGEYIKTKNKERKSYKWNVRTFKNANEIGRRYGFLDENNNATKKRFSSFKPAKRAHLRIAADKAGMNSDMVVNKIMKKFDRI